MRKEKDRDTEYSLEEFFSKVELRNVAGDTGG